MQQSHETDFEKLLPAINIVFETKDSMSCKYKNYAHQFLREIYTYNFYNFKKTDAGRQLLYKIYKQRLSQSHRPLNYEALRALFPNVVEGEEAVLSSLSSGLNRQHRQLLSAARTLQEHVDGMRGGGGGGGAFEGIGGQISRRRSSQRHAPRMVIPYEVARHDINVGNLPLAQQLLEHLLQYKSSKPPR
jgi:hypothetical protein